jgi:hypothetical protein
MLSPRCATTIKPIETDGGTAHSSHVETCFSVKDSIGAKVGYMFESSLVKLIYTVSLAQGCRFSKSIALTTSSSELIPPAIKQ